MKIDQNLGIAVWQKAIDGMGVLDAFEIDKYLNKLTERKCRMCLIDDPIVRQTVVSLSVKLRFRAG